MKVFIVEHRIIADEGVNVVHVASSESLAIKWCKAHLEEFKVDEEWQFAITVDDIDKDTDGWFVAFVGPDGQVWTGIEVDGVYQPADVPPCDICGSEWDEDHLCPVDALRAELEKSKAAEFSAWAITMGLDESHDAREGWLQGQLRKAIARDVANLEKKIVKFVTDPTTLDEFGEDILDESTGEVDIPTLTEMVIELFEDDYEEFVNHTVIEAHRKEE